jgi:hypothetical protein
MGRSADGILAYGFELGGSDEWLVREAGEYGELELDWYNEASEDDAGEDESGDFADAAAYRLLAEKALGVKIQSHGYDDPPQYLLVTKVLKASQGEVEDAGAFIAIADDATRQEWDVKLRAALEVLGLTPKQEHAKWLLCSDYG